MYPRQEDTAGFSVSGLGATNLIVTKLAACMAHYRLAPSAELEHLMSIVAPKNANLLIRSADNLRQTLWGSLEINEVG